MPDRITVLVVEDELEVRAYFEVALECLGYKAELAQDGDAAIEILNQLGSEVQAVVLDLLLPNRDGIETLREIRSLYPTLPVILVSGPASPLNIVAAMKNGAADFLTKPVSHQELR